MGKNNLPILKIPYLLLCTLLVLMPIHSANAEVKTFLREYNYQASEIDSKVSCRTIALEQVKRLLLEEIGVYLESITIVKDSQLTQDKITTLSAGIVRIEILDEQWDGKTYYISAKVSADPDVVIKTLNSLRNDYNKLKEFEEMRGDVNNSLKEMDALKSKLVGQDRNDKSTIGQDYEQYSRIIKKLDLITPVESLFRNMKEKNYVNLWELLSHNSKNTIVDQVYGKLLNYRFTGTRERIRDNFKAGGDLSQAYWKGYLSTFNPDALLKDSTFEIGILKKDVAEIKVYYKYRKTEGPVILKMFNEYDGWKVGLSESFFKK